MVNILHVLYKFLRTSVKEGLGIEIDQQVKINLVLPTFQESLAPTPCYQKIDTDTPEHHWPWIDGLQVSTRHLQHELHRARYAGDDARATFNGSCGFYVRNIVHLKRMRLIGVSWICPIESAKVIGVDEFDLM